jgi:hypothetical protein
MTNEEMLPVPHEPASGSKWKHFKGGEYRIVMIARDCEDPNRFLVVYRNIQHGTIWVRERDNFLGIHENGQKRFTEEP